MPYGAGLYDISIHALLAESDDAAVYCAEPDCTISIHALLAESDRPPFTLCLPPWGFLSTLSLRRATTNGSNVIRSKTDFYPRSPCGERPVSSGTISLTKAFLSTLSLRRATVKEPEQLIEPVQTFLSTLSLRRATPGRVEAAHGRNRFLSTLSLRRATKQVSTLSGVLDFYPRSPCGERQLLRMYHIIDRVFLSTLSLRRATRFQATDISARRISIHALLAESDGQCR